LRQLKLYLYYVILCINALTSNIYRCSGPDHNNSVILHVL